MSNQLTGMLHNSGAINIQGDASKVVCEETFYTAPFWRRLFAMLYDSFLVGAVLITGTAIALTFVEGDIPPGTLWFECYLIGLWALFFAWFWTHGGQTTGMAAWKIKAVTKRLQPLTWKLALWRFFWASICLLPLGVGLLWALFDKQGCTLYDRFSGTRLIRVMPKK